MRPPGVLLVFLLGVLAGATLGSVALAALVTGAGAGVTWTLIATPPARRRLTAWRADRAALARRRARERRLLPGLDHDLLAELGRTVAELERLDGGALVRRYELHELLDRFTEVAIAHDHWLRGTRLADRAQLARALADERARGGARPRRRAELLERRLHAWDRGKAEAERCAEELAAIAEFVRLVGQRACGPELLPDDDGLDRRLGELDEEERALRQLLTGEASPRLAAGG